MSQYKNAIRKFCIHLLLQMFLVSGGHGYGSVRLDSTEVLDPSLGTWRAGAALPSSRDFLRATNIDNRVLFFGNDILLTFDMMII